MIMQVGKHKIMDMLLPDLGKLDDEELNDRLHSNHFGLWVAGKSGLWMFCHIWP
jgi:hypothetical protein